MTTNKLFTLLAATGIALSASVALAQQPASTPAPKTTQPADKHEHKDGDHKDANHKHDEKSDKKTEAKVGEQAPDFTLTDTDGKTVKLSDYKGKKTVVLEWFNPACPFIVKHHKDNQTFNDLYTQYNSKDVVFLAINSSAEGKEGYGKELNAKKKTEFKMEYPILLDSAGTVGMAYGAKNTPTCYVIDKDGKLVYRGAIDNDPSPNKAGSKNYVKAALDQVLKGETVTESNTKPYGCGVKYAGK